MYRVVNPINGAAFKLKIDRNALLTHGLKLLVFNHVPVAFPVVQELQLIVFGALMVKVVAQEVLTWSATINTSLRENME